MFIEHLVLPSPQMMNQFLPSSTNKQLQVMISSELSAIELLQDATENSPKMFILLRLFLPSSTNKQLQVMISSELSAIELLQDATENSPKMFILLRCLLLNHRVADYTAYQRQSP
ncbi:hypothetical protein SRHO_G00202590 [Serrasalmus rhombeus]